MAALATTASAVWFNALYARSLVHNTCWEDPAVDRQILALGPQDHVMVITSAGCNTFDYALQGPASIHAVDANPRQNALLELKLAAIRQLDFEDFFAIFGDGFHPRFRTYFRMRPQLACDVQDLLACQDLATQRDIYDTRIAPELWTPTSKWILNRQLTMSLLGVPHPQRRLVQAQHPGGVAGFIRDAVEYVFRHLPVKDNYFWHVYLNGRYTPECCPEYLKRDSFLALKDGLADSINLHTCTVTEFLQDHEGPISRFVLLDHMDWMSSLPH